MVYKWIDGTPLSWGALYTTPWKDSSTPVDDATMTCVKMEWGASLNWKHHSCDSTEDFLCEGIFQHHSRKITLTLIYYCIDIAYIDVTIHRITK